ncbi:MAG: hypothetical protein ABFD50_20075 [Smithella sp.]
MKPIIFSTQMIQAILSGNKTQTRRVIKPQPSDGLDFIQTDDNYAVFQKYETSEDMIRIQLIKSRYLPGDILWVRETFFCDECLPNCPGRTDKDECPFNRIGDKCYGYKEQYTYQTDIKWRPSIFMPKEAARLFLQVTDVYPQKLQDITEQDAKAEGAPSWFTVIDVKKETKYGVEYSIKNCPEEKKKYTTGFKILWDSINAKRGYSFESDPWVWVISFRIDNQRQEQDNYEQHNKDQR